MFIIYGEDNSKFKLQEPRDAQASFSSETSPTVWRAIPTLECLQNRWETMARTPKFAPVRVAIEKGLEKVRKWYKTVNGNDVYFVCLGVCSTFPSHLNGYNCYDFSP